MTELPIDKALLERNVATGGFDVHILAIRNGDGGAVMQGLAPPVLQHFKSGEFVERQPAFSLSERSAQSLLDSLWNAGVRPTNASQGQEGVIGAMREHLEDLRHIVFSITTPQARSPDKPQSANTDDIF